MPEEPNTNVPVTSGVDKKAIEDRVISAIKECYDPEIPVNIWELGLVYEISVNDDPAVNIKMTLTAPGCPAARSLPIEVHERVAQIEEVKDVNVEIVWDPPWTPEMMSQEAKLELGFM